MILEIPDRDKSIRNPSDQDIIDAMNDLKWAPMSDGCIDICTDDPFAYLQIIITKEGSFDVEFQEGAIDKHWISRNTTSKSIALDIALRYNLRDDSWRGLAEWKPFDASFRGGIPVWKRIGSFLHQIWANKTLDAKP